MAYRTRWFATSFVLAWLLAHTAGAQQMDRMPDSVFATTSAAALKWSPIQPAGFEPGTEIAVVRGDPAAAGKPYVIRLRFPDGYRFPPHWHPVAEHVTVLDGRFLLAMGEKVEASRLATYLPGDFVFIEGKHPHFGGAQGRTTIQLHGMGPFDIVVVGSPQDKR